MVTDTPTTSNNAEDEEEDCPPPNLGTPHHHNESPLPEVIPPAKSTSPPRTRPAEVKAWTVTQVSEWLCEQGSFEKEADAFRQQDIDGACLMLLKKMSVLTDVGIKLGPAVKIFDRIKRLQAQQLSQQQQQSQADAE